MIDVSIFTLTPRAIGELVAVTVSLLTLLSAIRIPLKRRYHYLFLIFVVDVALWRSAGLIGQLSGNLQTYALWIWWLFLFGNIAFPLLYHFTLLFVSPKLGRLKYTLIPSYLYGGIFTAMLMINPALVFTAARRTPIGFQSGPGALDFFFYPLGINWSILAFLVAIVILLLRYYRSNYSPIVRGQIRYLAIGGLIFFWGYQYFAVGRYLGGLPLVSYFASASIIVIFLGIRKYGFFAIMPVAETQSKIPLRYNLPQGSASLAFEPEPKQSFEVFSNLVLNGYYGLCITRSPPNNIRETYGLKTTPILWLTEEKGDEAVAPSDLHGLLVTIKAFLQKAERSVIMLHGSEYLVSVNGFKPVMRLIVRLNDLVLQKNAILLLPVVPGTMNEKQQTFLSAECPSLQRLEVSQSGEAIASPFQPRQELHPLLANAPLPAEAHAQEPLQFKRDDAEKTFRFLAKAFLQDYTVSRLLIDAAGWRTTSEIAEGTKLPARKMYGRDGGPGLAIAELLKRGLVETRWVTGQRGRGGTIMKVRVNNGNPYVKAEVDRLALQP